MSVTTAPPDAPTEGAASSFLRRNRVPVLLGTGMLLLLLLAAIAVARPAGAQPLPHAPPRHHPDAPAPRTLLVGGPTLTRRTSGRGGHARAS